MSHGRLFSIDKNGSEINFRKPSQEEMDLLMKPGIDSLLPIKFKNGHTIEDLDCRCDLCGSRIPTQRVRGMLHAIIDNVVTLDAASVCLDCNALSRQICRFRHDGTYDILFGTEWIKKNIKDYSGYGLLSRIVSRIGYKK